MDGTFLLMAGGLLIIIAVVITVVSTVVSSISSFMATGGNVDEE